jgi:hypothetical protein
MVDEIKEYYNLNDTLLASDLGIMQQTIKGWRDGRQPTLPNYNKVKAMYDKMKQEAVDESIVQRFEALEEKVEKKSYEVKVPKNLKNYFCVDEGGDIKKISIYNEIWSKKIYECGSAFETREAAERYDRERILLFKMHKWAEEHNGGWKPDWKDFDEYKFSVAFDFDEYKFLIKDSWYENTFSKLPYFISRVIAEQFIEEFGDEIKEVLC